MSEFYTTVDALHRALTYHVERHNVLSSNVANVDTPGFQPMELIRPPENSKLPPIGMAGGAEGHMGTVTPEADPFEAVEDRTTQPGADGNAVDLDREMSKLAANDLRYDAATRIVSRQLAMLRYAANGGQG